MYLVYIFSGCFYLLSLFRRIKNQKYTMWLLTQQCWGKDGRVEIWLRFGPFGEIHFKILKALFWINISYLILKKFDSITTKSKCHVSSNSHKHLKALINTIVSIISPSITSSKDQLEIREKINFLNPSTSIQGFIHINIQCSSFKDIKSTKEITKYNDKIFFPFFTKKIYQNNTTNKQNK